MEGWPGGQARHMARWDLAGSAGALAGPLLLTAVLAAGGSWRAGFLAQALFAGFAWLGALLRRPPVPALAGAETGEQQEPRPWTERARETLVALRSWKTLRWLLLIEVANLLVDVFTGFLALYQVDVVHLPPAVAALAIAIRLGAALAGDAALIAIGERVGDLTVLRVSAT